MHRYILIGMLAILASKSILAQEKQDAHESSRTGIEEPTAAMQLDTEIDLETAVLFSLHQNPNIKISRTNVDLRAGQLQSAGGEFDWTPFASVGYNHTELPVLTIIGPSDVLISETVEYRAGIRKKFRNGITVTPSVSTEIETTQAVPQPQASTSVVNLDVLIPLLRGSGTTSTNAYEKALEYDLQAAQFAYLQVLSDQAFTTITAYWRYAASRARLDILASIEERAQGLVESTKSMIAAKVLPSSVLPQAKANLNDQRALYVAAKIEYAKDRYAFALALGLQADNYLHIPFAKMQAKEPTKGPEIAYSELIRLTNNHRADINSIRKSLDGRAILVDGAKRDLLPRLDLTLSGGYTGGSRETEPLTAISDNVRGANFGMELNMDFPVGNNYQQGNLSQQESDFYRVEQQLIQLKQQVTANALESLEVVRLATERLQLLKEAESQYKEAVNIASKRFTEGEGSAFELIDTEGRYANSTISSITALRDYYIAVARLRYETGTFFKELSHHGSFTLNKLSDPNILTTNN